MIYEKTEIQKVLYRADGESKSIESLTGTFRDTENLRTHYQMKSIHFSLEILYRSGIRAL